MNKTASCKKRPIENQYSSLGRKKRQRTNTIQIHWIVNKKHDVPNNIRYRFAAIKKERRTTKFGTN